MIKNSFPTIHIFLLTILIISCHSFSEPQKERIEKASKNKKEISGFIKHANKTDDSLYIEAANQLLFYMQFHKSAEKLNLMPQEIYQAYTLMDTLVKENCYELDKRPLESECKDRLIEARKTVAQILSNMEPIIPSKNNQTDLQCIPKEFLIEHLQLAFENRANSKYAKNLSQNDFFETFIPYRSKDELLNNSAKELKTNYYKYLSQDGQLPLDSIILRLNYYLQSFVALKGRHKRIGNLGFYNIVQWEETDCDEQSVMAAHILNACGIPTNVEFTTHWLNREVRHYWNTVWDTKGNWLPFSPKWQALSDTSFFKRTSKVYRQTYATNANTAYYLKNKNEKIPEIFDSPFIRDVTNNYHQTAKFNIQGISYKENNLGYLSIFSPKGFAPVAWGKFQNDNITLSLENIPVDAVYFPTVYSPEGLSIPYSNPFYLDKNSTIHKINPNRDKTIDLVLTSKRPQKDHQKEWLSHLRGSKFQGANKADFSDAVDLYIMNTPPNRYVQEISTLNKGPFRYVRFIAGHKDEMNMAIMEYFTKSAKSVSENYGTLPHVLNPSQHYLWNKAKGYRLLEGNLIGDIMDLEGGFDGKMQTYTAARWAGIDFEKPQRIDKIRFAGRSADNMIVAGHTYQLLLFDEGWKNMETQIAKYNYLLFKSMPSEAIYWLRNLTTGKEELSFFYENGKQVFINHDDVSGLTFLQPTP